MSTGSVSQVTLSGLFFDTTYYWQVRASNSAGTIDADGGTWWSFTTEVITAPEAFAKVSPLDATAALSPNSVVLAWEETYGAYSYEYCVTEATSCGEDDWGDVGLDTTATVTNLKFETTYNWQVRALNTDGTTVNYTYANAGVMWDFTTLDTFSKLLPANLATNQKTRLTLTWEKLGASTYAYCIDDTAPGRLEYATLYYWQVRASNGTTTIYANDDNDPLTSDWWSFTTAARNTPSRNLQFEKISPQDGATDVFTAATLKWINVGATKYEYCIDDVEVTIDTCTWNTVGTATSITISGLSYGTRYYWQVRATINDVLTYADKGAFWDFATTFNKLTPENNALDQAINGLTLKWEAVTDALGYQYCLVTAESCADNNYVSTSGAATEITVNALSYGTKYYWQVRANIGTSATPLWLYANGSPTGLWRFTTEALEKFSPMDGEVDQPVNITLEWNEVTDAIEYQYCLVTVSSCAETDYMTTKTETAITKTGLYYATKYYWQVRANVGTVDDEEWIYADGLDTAFWSFTTEDMVKISPVDGALNQPIDITLDWGDVSAAIQYEYCLAKVGENCTWVATGTKSSIKLTVEYSTTYYWQVRANIGTEDTPDWIYADGEYAFWYFTTMDEPVVEP